MKPGDGTERRSQEVSMELPDGEKALLMELTGKLPEAEFHYRKGLAADPRDRNCVLGLARLLIRQGRGNDARGLIAPFAGNNPGDAEAAALLASLPAPAAPDPGTQGGYYGKDYFDWQKSVGAFGGIANLFKFREFISPSDTVIDLGSGGGFLLRNISCARKLGIEINPVARREAAESAGIEAVERPEAVPDAFADVIVSNHALEHMHSPLDVLRSLLPKLKPGGKLVIVVPSEPHRQEWDPADINKHLFTWNPMTLGNLVSLAGFRVLKAEAIQHQWPPRFAEVFASLGEEGFHAACREEAQRNGNFQVRVVATR
jgi:SAM-dependent methyltransferase